MQRTKHQKLSVQVKRKARKIIKEEPELDGNFKTVISTGSTLLDLAISGKRIRGGGIPGGVLVEAFGPSQSGKTALLCEINGNVERQGGDSQFYDPEARLDKQFANMFGIHIKPENYFQPDTVTEVFGNVRKWEPNTKQKGIINGVFADSLAALSTDMEMTNEDGDKMGGRRAKEFSEQLRKTCRIIKQTNYIMVCSNQVRMNMDGNKYAPKYSSPGGEAIKFYSSIRCRFNNPEKIYNIKRVAGKEVKKVIGIRTLVEVVKTVDDPFRKAPMTILFDYGIDNIRENLQYIKDFTKNTTYTIGETKLSNSMDEAIIAVEESHLENKLNEQVIDLWEEIESKFSSDRKKKWRLK